MTIPTAQAFLYQAPTGVPGDIVMSDETNVEAAMLIAVSTVFAQAFGIPMVYVAGGISQYATGNVAVDFAGVLVREAPGISGNANAGLTNSIPNPVQPQGLCVRGYVNVVCTIGTPARGGVVYVRTVASGGAKIGDFEATSDPGNNVALTATQAEWAVDGKDATNNTTVRVAR